ncbi:MAG: hypothetical protein U5K00_08690 [Melioribacteraceae bacterium]|nr:hypothetical protein [Melioribacteraceae bacterium]
MFIITYNHFTGLIYISGIFNFLVRLLFGTTFSALFGVLIVFIDLKFITPLDEHLPLPEKLIVRIPTEVIISILVGAVIGTVLTFSANFIFPYEDGLQVNIVKNALIVSVINLIVTVGLEAMIWFKRNQAE